MKRDPLWFYNFSNAFLRFVFSLILRVEVRGTQRVPRDGALIIAISHSSWLDPVLLGPYLPRYIASMGKVEIFSWPILGGILRAYGAFPVRRGKADVSAFKVGLQILKQGYAMGIAPEGHRSESGKLQRGREGAIMLAIRSGAVILPVAVWGGKPLWKNLARFRKTPMHLYVGAPVALEKMDGRVSRELLSKISDELMYYLAQLMPADLHGYYEGNLREPEYLLPVKRNEGGDG
ncbi:MAG: 1-acyl-sn-glycerol-3-phosphate acyltransferase [Chloroflexi bacterium]|nr:1-acyl-sn-glycerol-3-phosphate acyltransferase [Chloroflexota bacterium]